MCDELPPMGGELRPIDELGFVAHAGGSPGGLLQTEHYSNTREAFEVSYLNGFRTYELDFVTLADGTVVAAHDYHEERYGLDIMFTEATREDLEGALWQDRYPLLFAEDVIDLLVEYPDVWLIIDSKWDHTLVAQTLVDLAPDASVADRLVPHLASAEHTAELEEVYPFPERMIAGYRWRTSDDGYLGAMAQYGIDNIMLWWDRRWTTELQARMDEAGYHVWVHTPEEAEVIEDFRSDGIGVYSNGYITCP